VHRILLAALIALSLLFSSVPLSSAADTEEVHRSARWTQRLFEENSLTASLLYLPNFLFGGLVRAAAEISHGREHPYVTIPPPAHRASH